MKVLHIITGLGDGGAEAVLWKVVTTTDSVEHEVISLTSEGKYGALMRQRGIPVVAANLGLNLVLPVHLVKLFVLIVRSKATVVQTWMYHADCIGGLLSRLAGMRRVVWGIHHSELHESLKPETRCLIRLNALLSLWVPSTIVCCAESARMTHKAAGFAESKMTVIPNGVDITLFRPRKSTELPQKYSDLKAEQGMLFGVVARFHPVKDHLNLLDALAQLNEPGRNWRCLMIGEGITQNNQKLMSWIIDRELTNRLILLGQRSDVPQLMSLIDILILPSLSEASPNVLIEAMASGTPCISTDVGDAANIIGDSGWIVPRQNFVALTKACNLALVNYRSESWSQRCEAARFRATSLFSLGAMIDGYLRIWHAVGDRKN